MNFIIEHFIPAEEGIFMRLLFIINSLETWKETRI